MYTSHGPLYLNDCITIVLQGGYTNRISYKQFSYDMFKVVILFNLSLLKA